MSSRQFTSVMEKGGDVFAKFAEEAPMKELSRGEFMLHITKKAKQLEEAVNQLQAGKIEKSGEKKDRDISF